MIVPLSVAIVARMIVPVFAQLVPINVRITVNTTFSTKPVGIAVCLVRVNAAGSVVILPAQTLAKSHAIDQDVTNHAKKSYHVTTPVLVFVVRNNRNFASDPPKFGQIRFFGQYCKRNLGQGNL